LEEGIVRSIVSLFAICFVACTQLAVAQTSSPAPADEYFGRLNASVLEIRNRLNDFDRRSDSEMLHPEVRSQLDELQDAIVDWQHKYPADPWLPRSFAKLLREYHRAGFASSDNAMLALNVMQHAYPDAPETSATVALVYGNGEAPIVADDPQPSVPDAWARFNALRYGSQANP
jgi:hypothetical protein